MPIQERESASASAAEAEPKLNPTSTSNPNFIPMKDRRDVDIEVPKSKDQSCSQMSNFITDLLRHRSWSWRRCRSSLRKSYWEMKTKTVKGFKMLTKGSKTRFEDDSALVSNGQSKRFQYCLKLDESERSCILEPIKVIQHSGIKAPVDPVLQDNVLLPMNFIKYVYHVGHGNELKSTVHNGLISGGFSTKTFFAICHKQESRL